MSEIYKIQSVVKTRFRVTDAITLNDGTRCPCITGLASHTEVVSQKGYRYRAGFWEKQINNPELQARIENRDMLGMIEHPISDEEYMSTPYDKASHIIIRAWMEGKDPAITAALLNNPQGNAIKALIDLGHRPGTSTRGFGMQSRDDVSEYVEPEGFALITWDIVRTPNFEDLKMDKVSDSVRQLPAFKELVQMHGLHDSVDDHYSESSLLRDIDSAITYLRSVQERLRKEGLR